MGTVISIITILVSIVLILVVLVQNSKGGGLSSNFSSSNQIMGAPKTADFLEKATWALAGTVIVLSLISAKFFSTTGSNPNDFISIPTPVDNTQVPDMGSSSVPSNTATPEFPSQQAPQN